MTDRDYIAIHAWMWSCHGLGLKLGSIELCLYARIYGYSRKGAGIYFETQEAAARAFEVSVRQIQRCVKSLCESELIIEVGRYRLGNSHDARRWRVSQEAIDRAIVAYDRAIASLSSGDKMACEASPDKKSGDHATDCHMISSDILSGAPNDHLTESRSELDDGFKGSQGLKNNQNTILPSILAAQEKYEQLDSEARLACIALMLKSLNQRATSEEVAGAYMQALEKGYTPDQIAQAYERYISRYRRDNPDTTRYAMRLDNYLTRGDGLRFDMPKPANRKKRPPSAKAGSTIEQSREAFTERLCNRYPEYNELVRKRSAAYGRHGKATLQKDEITKSSCIEEIADLTRKIEAFEAEHINESSEQKLRSDIDG